MMKEDSPERLEKVARCLRVLSHPTRLHLITLLAQGELSVQEHERQVQASQSGVSQHLNLLKNKDIWESRRAARQVLYRLKDPWVLQLTALTQELFCKECLLNSEFRILLFSAGDKLM